MERERHNSSKGQTDTESDFEAAKNSEKREEGTGREKEKTEK